MDREADYSGHDGPSTSSYSNNVSLELNTPSHASHGRRPKSPLNPDVQFNSTKARHAVVAPNATSTVEYLARGSRSSPLSIPTQSRNPSSRIADRQASMGISRSPYAPVSKFFVTVIPPAELSTMANSPNVRSPSSATVSPHLRRGTLMPLYPTLGGQLYAISREYGLPSIGGLTIYLCDDGEGNSGPRIGEETWPFIWARYFDEQADGLYQDITSPVPSFFSAGHARRSSSFSTEGRRDERSPAAQHAEELGIEQQDDYRPESSSFRTRRFPSSQYDTSSRQYMTPSPLRGSRQDPRMYASSPSASAFGSTSRLPIVARIEWAVDTSRAPWWTQWLRRESNSQDVASIAAVSPMNGGVRSARAMMPQSARSTGRRSMHLAQLRNENDASSSATHSPSTVDAKSTTVSAGRHSMRSEQSAVVSANSLNVRKSGHGYLPLGEEEDNAEVVQQRSLEAEPAVNGLQVTQGGSSYETQSYAGYSAVISTSEGSQHDASSSAADDDEDESYAEEERHEVASAQVHSFNPRALNDDSDWQSLQAAEPLYGTASGKERVSDAIDEDVAEVSEEERIRGAMVHQWVAKHHSPPLRSPPVSNSVIDGKKSDADEAADEQEQSVGPNDIDEVVGLWAEKAISAEGVPSLSEAVEKDVNQRNSTSQSVHSSTSLAQKSPGNTHSRNSSSLTASSSKRPASRSSSVRHSGRSLALDEATPVPQLQTNSVAMDDTIVEHQPDVGTQVANTQHKLSLLSPIALQDGSSTFDGPNADLRDFLPEHNKEPAWSTATDSQPISRQDSINLETPTFHSPAILSPSHLEPPMLRSPGHMSGSSSASDMSDSLIDMERALALLSPAGFQPSPSIDAGGAPVRRGGELSSALTTKRSRVSSGMSATENMERARTLSASVSPSLRFFQAGEVGYPPMPDITSPSDAGSGVAHITSPTSMAALVQAVSGNAAASAHLSSPPLPLVAERYDTPLEKQLAAQSPPKSVSSVPTEDDVQRTPKVAPRPDLDDGEELIESYDDFALKDFTMRDQWIAAQQQQLPSSPEASSGTLSGRESALSGEALNENQDHPSNVTKPQYATVGVQAELDTLSRDSSQFSLVSGDATSEAGETDGDEYDEDEEEEEAGSDDGEDAATHRDGQVGAGSDDEIDETPRVDQQHAFNTPTVVQESGDDDDAAADFGNEVHNLEPINRSIGTDNHSNDSLGQASVFNRLLRAESLSGSVSDVFSSSMPSPNEISNETSLEDTWLHQKQAMATEAFHTYLIDHAQRDQHELPPHDDSTTTRGGESTNRNSLLSNGDQWSQDGSVYDDDHEENVNRDEEAEREEDYAVHRQDGAADVQSHVATAVDYEDDAASDAGSYSRRRSRMSTLSSHREALENAGGLTPTFLYERHLTDHENASGDRLSRHSTAFSSLSPISAEYGAEVRNSMLVRQSSKDSSANNDNLRAVDALGISSNNSSSARLPLPSQADILARKTIISMAGEQMDDGDADLHMPSGFEQVYVQSPTRSVSSAGGMPITRSETTDGSNFRRVASAVAEKPLRRSMGSISEKRSADVDPDARRASASAARPIALTLPGPRRGSPRPTAKMMATSKDGVALPLRRSMSPHSPRPRFGALPPSPSLQANMVNLKSGAVNSSGQSAAARYGNISSSYGSPPDPSALSPNLIPHNGFSPSLHSPAPRRVGSPLVIDTAKAQSYESEPSALHEDVMSVAQTERDSPPPPFRQPAQTQTTPIFRGKAASATTPPSPRGPRAPPFAVASPSTMPLTSAVLQQ